MRKVDFDSPTDGEETAYKSHACHSVLVAFVAIFTQGCKLFVSKEVFRSGVDPQPKAINHDQKRKKEGRAQELL